MCGVGLLAINLNIFSFQFAGVFMILGTILYAAKNAQPEGSLFHFHAGFGLCIVAGVLAVLAGILDLMVSPRTRRDSYTEI